MVNNMDNLYDEYEPTKAKDTANAPPAVGSKAPVGARWFGFLRRRSSDVGDQPPPGEDPPRLKSQRRRRHTMIEVEKDAVAQQLQQHPQYQRSSSMEPSPSQRCPSIPTSIHPIMDNIMDADDSACDNASVVSEVTLMTYSEEKAEMIKEEFIQRLREPATKQLTLEEKKALLLDIQQEHEWKFNRQKNEEKEELIQKRRQSASDKKEFFERLDGLRLKTETEVSERRLSQPNDANKDGEELFDNVDLKPATKTPRGDKNERTAKYFAQSRRSSWASSFCSAGTMMTKKHRNSQPDNKLLQGHENSFTKKNYSDMEKEDAGRSSRSNEEQEVTSVHHVHFPNFYTPAPKKSEGGGGRVPHDVHEEVGSPQEPQETHQEKNQQNALQQSQPRQAQDEKNTTGASSTSETSSTKAHIDTIIELKLLMANQQAAIDTLSTKLHNVEVANRHLVTNNIEEASLTRNLEVKNRNLATQLNKCRERENSLRKELNLQQHVYLDISDKEQREELLEGRNHDLMNENSELRRQLQELRNNQCSHLSNHVVNTHVVDGRQRRGSGKWSNSQRSSMTTYDTAMSTDADSTSKTV